MATKKKHVTTQLTSFSEVLKHFQDESTPFSPTYLHSFSDIGTEDLKRLEAVWPTISQQRRLALLEDLEELFDSDTVLSFEDVALMALTDAYGPVRVVAIRLLSEVDRAGFGLALATMMDTDNEEDVRAAAASGLGRYVELHELDEVPGEIGAALVSALIDKVNSPDGRVVRCAALESLGWSSHPDVPALVTTAFESGDEQWMASAVYAMGVSNSEQWESHVLKALRSPAARVKTEAVAACGKLRIEDARKPLFELFEKSKETDPLHDEILIALAQIGGEGVRALLEEEREAAIDEDQVEFLDDLLEELEFIEDSGSYQMFDFDDETGDLEDESDDQDEEAEDDDDEEVTRSEE